MCELTKIREQALLKVLKSKKPLSTATICLFCMDQGATQEESGIVISSLLDDVDSIGKCKLVSKKRNQIKSIELRLEEVEFKIVCFEEKVNRRSMFDLFGAFNLDSLKNLRMVKHGYNRSIAMLEGELAYEISKLESSL